ncbi:hypothetical protein PC9H_005192 [Pleurotus ostreatus]|uniref:AB hydrolase-1 domain-containing protein n=3 Tax=Pleurotus TaxID=5320 RepID=A0A067NQ68_PLEO1|nr:uncharacterized protein PC9H_005192 [Pleurotus ostreatus]KAF7433242.1 hypothetical protein PC9H_005192 [Pleurotus ostreatus]KAG9219175.1 hypothetical protein CCMSSC00406_0001585 [Pleurotus cornucopiae]KAJ8698101.1 hypothetical protein PTI98_004848 [Pleurotus ostreatus]KDQ29155.1 hypothetical protein PLEOSDRAFT_1089023 [Pleurotus ostreatus PC15]
MLHVEDKKLVLPDGRTLAYADNGNTSSSTVVLYLHGEFNIGDASLPSPIIIHKHLHFIAPSLPGWGNTSPPLPCHSYPSTLIADITALIVHLHPKFAKLKIYVYAHAFGTVPAQILYGASFDQFPLGKQVAGFVLLSPLSPPHCHKDYAKSMTWLPYILSGPPARYVPYSIIPRVASYAIAHKLKSEETAERFVRSTLIDNMSDGDRELLDQWLDARSIDEPKLVRNLAHTMTRSISQSWQGFLSIARVYHSGWDGYSPDNVDDAHASRPIIIISARGDRIAPVEMAEWLAINCKNATLITVDGGHLAPFFHLDEAWKEFLG